MKITNGKLHLVLLVLGILIICLGLFPFVFYRGESFRATPLSPILSDTALPSDFPTYVVRGKVPTKGILYCTPHGEYDKGWLLQLNEIGELLHWKEVDGKAYLYRHFQNASGEGRYAYCKATECHPLSYGNLEKATITLLDDQHQVLKEEIQLLPHGNVPSDAGVDIHDYVIYDDDHYLLLGAVPTVVDNIPGLEGQRILVFNDVIQEQKDGQVLWQWESIDYPELYEVSFEMNNYADHPEGGEHAVDYAHFNKVAFYPNGDLLVSFRHIGLVRINREDGSIRWVMGEKRNDFSNMSAQQLPCLQHDTVFQEDGSITLFDNGRKDDKHSRVLRLWLNEETMELEKEEEILLSYRRSAFMGSAQLLNGTEQSYLVCYGGALKPVGFEVVDGSTGKQEFFFRFDRKDDLYAVTQGDTIW